MLVFHEADVVSEYYNLSYKLHSVKNVSKNNNGQKYTTGWNLGIGKISIQLKFNLN